MSHSRSVATRLQMFVIVLKSIFAKYCTHILFYVALINTVYIVILLAKSPNMKQLLSSDKSNASGLNNNPTSSVQDKKGGNDQ